MNKPKRKDGKLEIFIPSIVHTAKQSNKTKWHVASTSKDGIRDTPFYVF